jgi:ABC-type uncharacterized transport system involved in gliding motility auxiliary subunit
MSDAPKFGLDGIKAWAIERASRLSRRSLAWGGLALAAVTLLSLNLASSLALKNWQADLTEDGLFTISEGTKKVLRSIDEPVTARLYFSNKLGDIAPHYARYFKRVRALLEQYRDISGGKLQLEIADPEPFSDGEDRAVAAGLRGLRLNAEGELGYFGLSAANATDKRGAISFFSEEREDYLEYDLTKLIYTLSNPKRRVIGLMTALPVDGGQAPMTGQPLPVWLIFDQVREFFDVEKVDMTARKIPDNIDVLIVAQPSKLEPGSAYAIDQFVMRGGKAIVFIDPMAESAQLMMMASGGTGTVELAKMLKGWGVDYDAKTVAADIKHARRVSFGAKPGQPASVTEFVTWLTMGKRNIDQSDVVSGGIDQLALASAGVLEKADGATIKFQPLIQTSTEAAKVDASKTGFGADPIALLRNYKAEGKSLTIAARISGDGKTAFPAGNPDFILTEEEKKAANPGQIKDDPLKGHVAAGKLNVIVVADTDLLANQFWVQEREVLGQKTQIPTADNAAFLVGALENLSGSDAMIELRGRGIKDRPFTVVEEIRRESERKFREKEQALTARLKSVESELQKLEVTGEGGATLLTDKEREAIDKFRGEMLETRRELREVKLDLRKDIDRLDGWLKFANIALVPLAIGFGGIGWTLWQSRKKRAEPAPAVIASPPREADSTGKPSGRASKDRSKA